MKKAKKYNVWSKVRSAMRKVWMYSPQRREALKAAQMDGKSYFCCLCKKVFEKWGMDVDHIQPCGSFTNWAEFGLWADRLFTNPLQAICKHCHLAKTKSKPR
jgi:5-methylcytosine-specific restriction endonuclease McrA